MVEVQLPTFPHTVLYMDEMYGDLKGDYIFPEHLVQMNRQELGIESSPLEKHPEVFDKLYNSNDYQRVNIKGHQTGEQSASIKSKKDVQELEKRLAQGDNTAV